MYLHATVSLRLHYMLTNFSPRIALNPDLKGNSHDNQCLVFFWISIATTLYETKLSESWNKLLRIVNWTICGECKVGIEMTCILLTSPKNVNPYKFKAATAQCKTFFKSKLDDNIVYSRCETKLLYVNFNFHAGVSLLFYFCTRRSQMAQQYVNSFTSLKGNHVMKMERYDITV